MNIDCGVYTQNGLNGSSFSNRGGHVSSQLGALGIPMSNMGIPTHRSVNQTFIVNKKRGIISEGECPSHNITLHNKSFDTSSRHTLSRFTKYL